MDIITVLNLIKAKGPVDTLVFTGICSLNRISAVYATLSPISCSAVGRLTLVFERHSDIPYRYEISGPKEAAADYEDNSIDILYIGNNYTFNSAEDELEAWLPKIRSGGYIICYDYNSTENAAFVETDKNTTEYPNDWYRIKE